MPSTHTNLHYHLIFSTKDRTPFLLAGARSRVHSYLGGIVRGLRGIPLEIGGTADHVHLLVGLRATHCLADVLRKIKSKSCRWIHEELLITKFAWQEGYGAFTVGGDLESVRRYIREQQEHHRTRSYTEEYREFLVNQGIEFDDRFLW